MKNKFKFADGSNKIPMEEDLNFAAWVRCNNLVHSWIINSITPSIAESVVFIEHAVDVWNDLNDQFMCGDRNRVAQLHQEIANLKQGHTVEGCYKKHGYPPNWGHGNGHNNAYANHMLMAMNMKRSL
jgi:hypothetical protein